MKLTLIFSLLLLLCSLCFWQCKEAPQYPTTPEITFLRMSKDSMPQSSFPIDSMTITFGFTDGDGNLGHGDLEDVTDIFVTDTRTGFVNKYRIPTIPIENVSNSLSGEISIITTTTCCITENFPPCFITPSIPRDTLIWSIQIMDRDSNMSNIIQTPPIVLGCN